MSANEPDQNHVLIIDDNAQLCRSLVKFISRLGMGADSAGTLARGLSMAVEQSYDVIFLDVNLPDGCGLDIIAKLRESHFPPEIIIITGYGNEDGAEIAIQSEAWDYIQKGTSFQNFKLSLSRALQYREQKREKNACLELKRDNIIGASPKLAACLERVSQTAPSDNPVLIMGETGTGKEIFARAVHENSRRQVGDFVIVDCAALPEHLVESTLFGHKKGAFTGADSDREGLVAQADGGTLFLDEIGELPQGLQKKFLRVLQEKRFRPVGGKGEVKSDFRLVCATHRNLSEMVEKATFRQDLYFRIKAIPIELPPLRERTDDIPALVCRRLSRRRGLPGERAHELSSDFLDTLKAYHWPGNVRELFNTMDLVHAEALEEPVLFPRHLPTHIRAKAAQQRLRKTGTAQAPPPAAPESEGDRLISLKEYLDEMRYRYIKDLMEMTGGNVPKACNLSKISRGHLYELLKKYNLR